MEKGKAFRLVYSLARKLEREPEYVALAQALTLNEAKPMMGLKGTHGLFGSPEWWDNLRTGVIPARATVGTITGLHFAGQDRERFPNTMTFQTDAGEEVAEGIHLNDKRDRPLYAIGNRVSVTRYEETLKDGSIAEFVLEMSIARI